MKRTISFTSMGMALGSFPSEAQVPDATINTACYFHKNQNKKNHNNDHKQEKDESKQDNDNDGEGAPPTIAELVTHVVEPLLRTYPRLSQIMNIETHKLEATPRPYAARDLIRTFYITGPESLTHQTIVEHLQDDLKIKRKKQTATNQNKDVDDGGNENTGDSNDDDDELLLPWWELLRIENTGSGPSAVVLRVHHALADGLSLVHAFSNILTHPQTGKPIGQGRGEREGGEGKTSTTFHPSIPNKPTSSSRPNILAQFWSLLQSVTYVLTLGISRFDDETAFSKTTPSPSPSSHRNRVHSGRRTFVLFPVIPLAFIKELKDKAACSVNDILMTAISQAIHDYCVDQKDPMFVSGGESIDERVLTKRSQLQCRALLPVAFPSKADELANPETALRNKWCLISSDIGVGWTDILDRLRHIHSRTKVFKETVPPRAAVQLAIQNEVVPRLLPHAVARQAVWDIFSRHSLVLTNVPGPQHPCCLATRPVKDVQLFFNNLLPQVDFITYDGRVYGNMLFDDQSLPGLKDCFAKYYGRSLVSLAHRLDVSIPNALQDYISES